MKALIGSIHQYSLNDVLGNVSYVIWFCGCNFRCPFCQNFPLVISDNKYCKLMDLDQIIADISDLKKFINFVHVTGGEPTLQEPSLLFLFRRTKILGIKTSLNTNGSSPDIISELMHQALLDHVAMDIKAPLIPKKYALAIGLDLKHTQKYLQKIKLSLELIRKLSFIEIRTTFVPNLLNENDIVLIAQSLSAILTKQKHFYVLQQFVPNANAPIPKFREGKLVPLSELKKIARKAREYLPNVVIRHINGVDYL